MKKSNICLKLFASFLVIVTIALTSLVGCDSDGDTTKNPDVLETTESSTEATETEAPDPAKEAGVVLEKASGGYEVTDFFGKHETVIIPSEYKGMPVISIRDRAFRDAKNIKSIVIPDSVKSIGAWVFQDCSSLESITFGNGVESIGGSAFNGCNALKSVAIPDSVKELGHSVFSGCGALESITFGDGLTSTGDHTFSNCVKLASVIFGSNIEIIDEGTFNGCAGLTEITIPDNVKVIGPYSFSGCTALSTVDLGNGVETIGGLAFSACSNLAEITIPGSVTEIHGGAFKDCSLLKAVNITNISDWCKIDLHDSGDKNPISQHLLLNGDQITELVIPEGVTSIGDYAFAGCASITSVEIPNSLQNIGTDAFKDCSEISKVNIKDIAAWCNIDFDSWYSNPLCSSYTDRALCLNGELVRELEIPEGVTNIGDYAFSGCRSIFRVVLPESLTKIGFEAFGSCNIFEVYNKSSIDISAGMCGYLHEANYIYTPTSGKTIMNYTDDGFLMCFADGYTHILAYFGGKTNIILPAQSNQYSSQMKINDFAFFGNKNITHVQLSDNTISIGIRAFEGCSGLVKINIPQSVTKIWGKVFEDCADLKIYAEAESKPSGWSNTWNLEGCEVVWEKS